MKQIITVFIFLIFLSTVHAKQTSPLELQLQVYQDLRAENHITELQYQHKNKQLKTQFMKNTVVTKGVGTAEISGRVLHSGLGVNGAEVRLYDANNNQIYNHIDYIETDINGNYTFVNLSAGSYYVVVSNSDNDYIDVVWSSTGSQYCSYGCEPPPQSIISLNNGAVSAGHDLNLTIGATLTGKIVDSITNDRINTLSLNILKPDVPNFNWHLNYQLDGLGNYTARGIPEGTYQVFLERSSDTQHIPEVYNGIQCNSCYFLAMESIGEPVSLINGDTNSGIDFSLEKGAQIEGFLVDAITLEPMEEAGWILLTADTGHHVESLFLEGTNWDPLITGAYSIGGLMPGTYFAEGSDLSPNGFHMRKLYDSKPCPYSGCDRMSGTPITLGSQEVRRGINFYLEHGGNISGNVTDAISGLPINTDRPFVQFYDHNGGVAGGAYADALTGDYTSARALPAGVYSARTGNMFYGEFSPGYIMQKYEVGSNIDCPGVTCDLTTGNITVTVYDPFSGSPDPEGDATTSGIDFALNSGLSFSGTISDLTTASPLANVHVLVYNNIGVFAHWATTDSNGDFTVAGLPAGTYYAKTNNGSNLPFKGLGLGVVGTWVDILYDSMLCPGSACDVTTGTAIVLGSGSPDAGQKGALQYSFSLPKGGTLSGRLIHSETTVGVPNTRVNVYNSQGLFNGSYESNINGYWMTSGFPKDTYYLTTQGNASMVDVKFGGDYCFYGLCDPLTADPIMLGGIYNITNINMILKPDFIFRSGLE